MKKEKEHYREAQYRPQARKTLRQALKSFIHREFPRLGGPWVIEKFVEKLLQVVDKYRFYHGKLTPGQVMWPAVVVDDPPAYRKPISWTRQTPVIVTVVNQDDIHDLRNNGDRLQLRNRAIVRAANDAYAQGGVLSCTDLGLLFPEGTQTCNLVTIALRRLYGNMNLKPVRLCLAVATSMIWAERSHTRGLYVERLF